ncbi:hypothetical protein D3C81_07450 [compost metagenome]
MLMYVTQCFVHSIYLDSETKEFKVYTNLTYMSDAQRAFLSKYGKLHVNHDSIEVISADESTTAIDNGYTKKARYLFREILKEKGIEAEIVEGLSDLEVILQIEELLKQGVIRVTNLEYADSNPIVTKELLTPLHYTLLHYYRGVF